MANNRMVVIDDLEPIEAEIVAQFLQDAVTNGDLELAIQDCITIRDMVDYHIAEMGESATDECLKCGKPQSDTIHNAKAYEVESQ